MAHAYAHHKRVDIRQQLEKEPYRFDFFQAVRLLWHFARLTPSASHCRPVGEDFAPSEEFVRFRALPSFNFPASSISSYHAIASASDDLSRATPPEMVVTFMGLAGANGVLPRHYTQLLIDRIRQDDFALRDFLDLFNHRSISLFYRAWEKHFFPVAYERAALSPEGVEEDTFTHSLRCLVGLGTGGLRRRLHVDDRAFLYFGGLFSHFPRPAISLERMIEDYFGVAVYVIQFHGQWLYLSVTDQTSLPSSDNEEGRNSQLQINAIVGDRVWGVENSFRIRLGPMGYVQFRYFSPDGEGLLPLCQLVRSYAGPDFDFDVQLVLKAAEVPCSRLDDGQADQSRLGWNTWLLFGPMAEDADDAVFFQEGSPTR